MVKQCPLNLIDRNQESNKHERWNTTQQNAKSREAKKHEEKPRHHAKNSPLVPIS